MEKRVLIIEDDERLAGMLGLHLGGLGCDVRYAYDGESGLEAALRSVFDLIVLDRSLPGMEGLEICRRIRAQETRVRILMLTALSQEIDLVAGFDVGADDYVGKPFKLAELTARVQALLRRIDDEESTKPRGVLERRVGALKINLERRKVFIGEREAELTPREFDLLAYLSGNPGRVFSREQILQNVWGSAVLGYEHSISTIIKRLRKKIELDSRQPKLIQTIRGVGYRLGEP